jgi:RNA polymerase sigma factor (sigma-70 family)
MTPLLARRPAADRSFERLYRRHAGDVYRYAVAVLRNRDDAEDVTQTTFLNAYRAYQRGERPDTPKNWLIAIAHNVCRQRFRQAQRRPQESPLFEDAAEAAVVEPDPEHTIEDVRRALSHLAFNQRTALVMRELEGRSYAEIAEIMGISVSAVETLIFRGRRALREQLEGTLTCAEAEFALSKQADGALARPERGQLRAHLRECEACATLARRHRASRGALKAIGLIPLPSSLASFFGGGSAVATGVAAKTAAVVCAGAVVGGVAYEGSKHVAQTPPAADRSAVVVPAPVVPAVPTARVVRRTPALAAGETEPGRAANHAPRHAAVAHAPRALRAATAPAARRALRATIALAQAPGQAKREAKAFAKAARQSTTRLAGAPPGAAVAQQHRSTRANSAPGAARRLANPSATRPSHVTRRAGTAARAAKTPVRPVKRTTSRPPRRNATTHVAPGRVARTHRKPQRRAAGVEVPVPVADVIAPADAAVAEIESEATTDTQIEAETDTDTETETLAAVDRRGPKHEK